MRTWLITTGEPLPLPGSRDRLIRTGRLASYLRQRGHDVVWWSSTFDHVRKAHRFDRSTDLELADGVALKLLHAPPYRSNVSVARLRHQYLTARAFRKRAPAEATPDVILCSFPTIELSAAALAYARRSGTRLVLDVRDLWPDIFVDGMPRLLRPLGSPFIRAYDRVARRVLRGADGIVGISEGYLSWALAKAGRGRSIDADIVLPIGFERPDIAPEDAKAATTALQGLGVRLDRPLAVFVGTFGRTYDLTTVIRAAARLERSAPDLQFVLAGDGERGEKWRQEALGLSNVVMPGWLSGAQIATLCSHAAIGLQAYASGAPQGLANKLFEYLGYGMALASSLSGENAALIQEHACGFTYTAGDVEELCLGLKRLIDENDRLRSARQNASALFDREFCLSAIHERFAAYLESQAKSRHPIS
jgi:glycosyltransferase involved in cell wall biosynthesis